MENENIRTDTKKKSDISNLMWGLGLGVSPIPIVGEVALSCVFYKLLKEQGVFPKLAGIPTALICRMCLYQDVYIPLAKEFYNFF